MKIIKTLMGWIWFNTFGAKGKYAFLGSQTAVLVSGELNESQCKQIVEKIDKDIDLNQGYIWKDNAGSDTRILGFEKNYESIWAELGVVEKIKEVEKYIGRDVKCAFLMANRIEYVEGNLGSGGGVHRDSPYANQIKFIWYLSDVGLESGPFEYQPHSNNSLKLILKVGCGQTRFESYTDVHKAVTGKAGDMLICDTKCLHRGKPLVSGRRYALTLYTSPNPNAFAKHLRLSGLSEISN